MTLTQTIQEKKNLVVRKKLRAQISVYSGNKCGGIRALRELVDDLVEGCDIICSCCGRIIWKVGHAKTCSIFKSYREIFIDDNVCHCDGCGDD